MMEKSTVALLVLNFILILWLPNNTQATRITPTHRNVSTVLNNMLQGYDMRFRPNYGGAPVDVDISMYVLSVNSISEQNMDFTTTFYFRQTWTDHRLSFTEQPDLPLIIASADIVDKIWVPDTFFANEKTALLHTTTKKNVFVRITPSGKIMMSQRLTMTAQCPMNLQYFPMDSQLCSLQIESYGYHMKDIRYHWIHASAVGISSEIELPQFRLKGHRESVSEIWLSTGNYSRLALEMFFTRSTGYYIMQIYIPSSIIVMISWVSFWLNRNAVLARVVLGVSMLMTMTVITSTANATLPKISYVKSVDIFTGACFTMIFATLLEFATVSYLYKKYQPTHFQNPLQSINITSEGMDGKTKDDNVMETENKEMKTTLATINTYLNHINPCKMDKYSRFIFPLAFVIFQIFYWGITLYKCTYEVEDLI